MDLFDLEPDEIEVLFYRCRDETPTQIQVRFGISTGEFFNRQNAAFTKLAIPGQAKQKFDNFRRKGLCNIVRQLTIEDIQNWYERREELRKKLMPPTSSPTTNDTNEKPARELRQWVGKNRQILWIAVGAVGLLFLGILVGAFFLRLGITPEPTLIPTQELTPNPTSQATVDVLPTETQALSPPPDTEVPTNTPSPTPTSEPTSTPDATVLFEDNFDGELMEVWKSPVYGDIPIITEDDRWLTFRGPTKFVLGDSSWTNYEVSLSMTGHNCQGFVASNTLTIGLRQQPNGETIAFRWFHQADGCLPVWLQGREDQWSKLDQDIFPVPPRNESEIGRRIVLTAQGDNFQTSYGGLISVSGFPNGGVVLIADDGVMIDNLVIRALP